MHSYVVISPVKDEARYIQTMLESMLAQTLRPARWIIVDDGSADRTPEIVEHYTRQHAWISLVRMPGRATRLIGSAEVLAFNAGCELAKGERFDFIVKLDGDLRIPPQYFEELLKRFQQDPRLGIASGVYLEQQEAGWKPVPMPEYHAAGACKVMRTRCFEEIGGFVSSPGWDTVDEIRAQTLGWHTRHFADLTFDHLRAEGSARGPLFTNRLHGEVYYMTGGSWSFLLFKVAHRLVAGKPLVLAGLMLLAGYLKPLLLGRKRLVSRVEARYYRRVLQQRLWSAAAEATGRLGLSLSSGRQI
jgi:glycosyltransferase involved in cell wall biosynthesis